MPIGNPLITPALTNAGEMHDPKMSGGNNAAHGVVTEPKMPVLASYLQLPFPSWVNKSSGLQPCM